MNGELSDLERQHGCSKPKLTAYTVTIQTKTGCTQHPVLAEHSVDAILIGIALAFPGIDNPPLFDMKIAVEAFK